MSAEGIDGLVKWLTRPLSPVELAERQRKAAERQEKEAQALAKIKELNRPYPLYICDWCQKVVGWRGSWTYMISHVYKADSQMLCYDCLEKSTYGGNRIHDALWLVEQGGTLDRKREAWVRRYLREQSDPPPPLSASLLRLVGARRRYELNALKNWQRLVGGDGWTDEPPRPVKGERCELLGAEKAEVDAPDDSGRLVLFKTGSYRWRGDGFERQRRRHRNLYSAIPTCFPADLELELLVTAYDDFKREVAAYNEKTLLDAERWRDRGVESAAVKAQAEQDKRDRLGKDKGISELLR
jgi:hypothetical protein